MEQSGLKEVPDRIGVLPVPGMYPHGTYGELDFTKPTIDQFVSNFADGVYGQTLPIDIEHDHLSGAAGHITALHSNEDGSVDADVTWTPMGKQLLAEDRFRYISPSILKSWTSPATRATHTNVLTGAALTVRPYFKTASLRPLITASEPVVTSPAEGKNMSEKTETQLAAEAEGSKIVAQQFGERLADMERKFNESEQRFAEANTAREAAEARVKALEDAALDRQFREELKGASDIEARLAIVRELSEESRKLYIADVQANVTARRQFAERGPVGSPVAGDGTSALDKLNAKAAEIRAADPKKSFEQAFSEAGRLNPDLWAANRADTRQKI